jgi:putative spermidine/putrescine transport system ATP-binding protein
MSVIDRVTRPSAPSSEAIEPATSILTVRGLVKRFGEATALDGVSIAIRDGEFLTLLGPSGSGKTTFLMLLAGFETPTEGRIDGPQGDITEVPAERRNFGMVFQGYALFPHMTVRENIGFPLWVRGEARATRRQKVDRMLEIVGLADYGARKPNQLSGGQQQRVALARALVFDPAVLLLDEPLAALDKNLREAMQLELKRIHREVGTTFVYVTHDQDEALAMSDRIAIFNDGKLVQVDAPEAIYRYPDSRFAAAFLGKVNMLQIFGARRGAADITADYRGRRLSAPMRAATERWNPDGVIVVRPEELTVARHAPVGDGNAVPAVLADHSYHGAHIRLAMTAPDGAPLTALISRGEADALAPNRGETLWLGWSAADGLFIPDDLNATEKS